MGQETPIEPMKGLAKNNIGVAGNGIITDISQVGGYPEYKGDPVVYPQHDGIPDWWKKKYGLDVNDPDLASKDSTGDGYTNIEKYLDGIDPKQVLDFKDPKNNVNTLTASKLFAVAEKPAAKEAVAKTDVEAAAYTQAIEKRTQDILALLDLKDEAKLGRVHDAIVAQYRALEAWQHTDRDAKQLASMHSDYVAMLAADLTPEQVETVKDKMTYNKLKVTYDAYCDIVPGLSDQEKAQILVFLKDAREEAIDGTSSKEKDAIFKKYKGKINNYLSAQGHDVGKAYKEFGAQQKAKTAKGAAKPVSPLE
jgi:hypothetical protein